MKYEALEVNIFKYQRSVLIDVQLAAKEEIESCMVRKCKRFDWDERSRDPKAIKSFKNVSHRLGPMLEPHTYMICIYIHIQQIFSHWFSRDRTVRNCKKWLRECDKNCLGHGKNCTEMGQNGLSVHIRFSAFHRMSQICEDEFDEL